MRPRYRPEIMRGIIEMRQAPVRIRRRILRGLALAAALIVGGPLGWRHRAALGAHYRAAKSFAVTWLGLDQEPSKKPAPASGAQPAAPAPASEAASLVTALPAPAPAPASAFSAQGSSATAPVKPPPSDHWALRGLVYDLYTLKPVAKAELTFASRGTGERLRARTDREGHFSLRLSKVSSGGYDIAVRHPRYLDNYLEENEPPYKTMSLERRQEAGTLFMQSEVLHVPYLPLPDEDRPWLDLVLMPQ
jgi:hypothetical protein